MAPIAKIFHNLPELSDDFRRLLKDLMDSAPDETTSTQVRRSMLTHFLARIVMEITSIFMVEQQLI